MLKLARRSGQRVVALMTCLALGRATGANAQSWPTEPMTFANGTVVLGGDVFATLAADDSGPFNATPYDRSAVRMLQLDLAASVRLTDHYSLLGEVRTQDLQTIDVLAAYLRIRPWLRRRFDLQVGRVPPTFGAFSRRAYGDNLLIGYPLAYQYLTSLRADAVPARIDELISMRGRGMAPRYSVGDDDARAGVPLVGGVFRWDTGAQAHVATERIEAVAAVTTGTVSNPSLYDGNTHPQIVGRFVVRPLVGLTLGASASRGDFVTDSVRAQPGLGSSSRSSAQTAWGGDVEYARDHVIVRSELVASRWVVPLLAAPPTPLALAATAVMIESRYRLAPGVDVAVRVDHLGFSEVSTNGLSVPWDAPVNRAEVGGAYAVARNVTLKMSYQRNQRRDVLPQRSDVIAMQVRARF